MKLSVVIVNYNVEYFLEQCLQSVHRAGQGIDMEVFVVDNNSVDGSVEMVESRFPWVKLMANKENVGFSRANNQAMRVSTGEYILLLNPDTVVQEETFSKCIAHMDAHPEAGGLGLKMVDGKGHYLPESKRGLPTPWVSLLKMIGLYRIFPKSRWLNRYYLGHLDKDENHEIEILSGAYMFMRKTALDKVGLLDEEFFMYGEDIDLSWRIIQGGFTNRYFADTSIIHYKGESTKKGSLNYVFVFYNAMVIFARKHFSSKNARLYSNLINMAIYLRAGIAVVSRFVKISWLPVLDFALIQGGLYTVKYFYENWQGKVYDPQLVKIAFALYGLAWACSLGMAGAYSRPIRILRVMKGIGFGAVFILVAYSLLPETLRFSRAMIVIGAAAVFVLLLALRGLLIALAPARFGFRSRGLKNFALVGKADEAQRVEKLLNQSQTEMGKVIHLDWSEEGNRFRQPGMLDEVLRVHNIQDLVFCARDVSSAHIIEYMGKVSTKGVDFKIAPPESLYIIGSNSIETGGEMFILDVNSVSLPDNRREKRMLDVVVSAALLLTLPVNIWFVKKKLNYLNNLFQVLIGRKTWVGFHPDDSSSGKLPSLRPGVLHPQLSTGNTAVNRETLHKLNVLYARDYRMMNDLGFVWRFFAHLGG
ncbi:MAG: glycosyltransferase [Flavobacteriales bacterium]|nr:glycosyltransferase [Flavobacteriales bacterium]